MKRFPSFSEIVKLARPRTLPASISPVIIGSALAFKDGGFLLVPALLCFGVAVFAQIASNMANDYFDFRNGVDTDERKGPERMIATGEVEPKPVLYCALISLCLSCLCGLGLLFFAPWWLIFVGIAMALCVFAYSAGPYPLSQHALGDVAVLLFYGLIPVCFTYFVQTGTFTWESLIYAVSVGLLSVNILIVNNYRDYEEDRAAGKITTIVLFGKNFGGVAYLMNLTVAVLLPFFFIRYDHSSERVALMTVILITGFSIWRELYTKQGKALNVTLGRTSILVFAYVLVASMLMLFGS